jgi:hypothetical protein
MRNSWSVTSCGVPTEVIVPKNRASTSPRLRCSATTGGSDPSRLGGLNSDATPGDATTSSSNRCRGRSVEAARLALQPTEQHRRRFVPVLDEAVGAARVKGEMNQIGSAEDREVFGSKEPGEDARRRRIGQHDVVGAMHYDGGERLGILEEERNHAADRAELRRVERLLPIERREAGRIEEHVPLPQRHIERLRGGSPSRGSVRRGLSRRTRDAGGAGVPLPCADEGFGTSRL